MDNNQMSDMIKNFHKSGYKLGLSKIEHIGIAREIAEKMENLNNYTKCLQNSYFRSMGHKYNENIDYSEIGSVLKLNFGPTSKSIMDKEKYCKFQWNSIDIDEELKYNLAQLMYIHYGICHNFDFQSYIGKDGKYIRARINFEWTNSKKMCSIDGKAILHPEEALLTFYEYVILNNKGCICSISDRKRFVKEKVSIEFYNIFGKIINSIKNVVNLA